MSYGTSVASRVVVPVYIYDTGSGSTGSLPPVTIGLSITKLGRGINHQTLIKKPADAYTDYSKVTTDRGIDPATNFYEFDGWIRYKDGRVWKNTYRRYKVRSVLDACACAKLNQEFSEWNDRKNKADAQARIKALASAQGATAEVPTILGEIKDTIRMIKHPLRSARDLLSNLQKARTRRPHKNVSDLLNAASGTYLEWKYGWMNLVKDIEDVAKTVDNIVNKSHSHHAFGEARDDFSPGFVWYDVYNGDFPGLGMLYYRTYSYHVRYRGGTILDVALDSGSMKDRFKSFGVSADNILPTIWELIPYSFVADWILPIGDVLKAQAAVSNANWLYFGKTSKETRSSNGTFKSNGVTPATNPGTAYYKREVSGVSRGSIETITRMKQTPEVIFSDLSKLPTLPTGHDLDALALITQSLTSTRKLNDFFSQEARRLKVPRSFKL